MPTYARRATTDPAHLVATKYRTFAEEHLTQRVRNQLAKQPAVRKRLRDALTWTMSDGSARVCWPTHNPTSGWAALVARVDAANYLELPSRVAELVELAEGARFEQEVVAGAVAFLQRRDQGEDIASIMVSPRLPALDEVEAMLRESKPAGRALN